jgi:23S rRNA (guanosine2251-2'-O)-methyltransferase
MNIVTLNALIEALQSGKPLNRVLVSRARGDKKIEMIKRLCRENRVAYQMVPPEAIKRKAGPQNQGVFAELSPVRFYELEEILKEVKTGLILILERITDMGNLGALIRTAVAAGVDGILISRRHSAPVNDTVFKTSAGALLKARIVTSRNLSQDIDSLKEHGFWIAGTDIGGGMPYYTYDFTAPTALIMGSEDRGLSALLSKKSDQLISIPHSKDVESLNVSAAAAVILFEALRQKREDSTGL